MLPLDFFSLSLDFSLCFGGNWVFGRKGVGRVKGVYYLIIFFRKKFKGKEHGWGWDGRGRERESISDTLYALLIYLLSFTFEKLVFSV